MVRSFQSGASKLFMAYRFKLDEPLEKGFRRIARDQIDRSLSELGVIEVQQGGVHESRKALKRLRSLVRLCAPAMGSKAAARRNASLRAIAKTLATQRDAAVLIDSFKKLQAAAIESDRLAMAPLAEAFAARAALAAKPLDPGTAQQARNLLLQEAKHLAKVKLKGRGFDTVGSGLEDSYRAGRRALRAAYRHPSNKSFHELRKAVQWHWRQMSVLMRAWPDVMAARVAEARELSQLLGDDHDYAVLADAIRVAADVPQTAIDAAHRTVRKEQAALRDAVAFRAARLFAEKPRAFAARIGTYWKAARGIRARDRATAAQTGARPAGAKASAHDPSSETPAKMPEIVRSQRSA